MTARELAILARHIIKTYPEYYPLFSQREFHYRKHKFFNRNPLLGLVDGVDGLKTGHHQGGGLRHRRLGQAGRPAPDRCRQRPRHRGRAPGRRAPAAGVGLQELLRGQAVRRRRGGRPCPRVGRRRACTCRWSARATSTSGCRATPPARSSGPHIVYKWPLKTPLKKGDQVAMLRVTTAGRRHERGAALRGRGRGARPARCGGGLTRILCLATRWLP